MVDFSETEVEKKKMETFRKAAAYYVQSRNYNLVYSTGYIICEFLNLVIVVLNWHFTNAFLSQQFTTYGSNVLKDYRRDEDHKLNPMDVVFPKVAKCDFHKYGPSGSLMRYDIMCVLALNIINEKIYVYLW